MITGEYPPQPGGVSDYSRAVARGLAAAGDTVVVYAPAICGAAADDDHIMVQRMPGRFGARTLLELSRRIGTSGDRLLVQYLPHAFGLRAMNLPFCMWLRAHARRHGGATIIFHEVVLGRRPGDPIRHRALDAVTRVMASLVAHSAARIFVTSSAWEPLVRRYVGADRRIAWLPVPSTIPVAADRTRIIAARRRFASAEGPLLGHFSAHPRNLVGSLLSIVPRVLEENPRATMVSIGANGESFQRSLAERCPRLGPRLRASGALAPEDLADAISACDVMLQPYPDGVTTRRTSMMAALAQGRPVVTSEGTLTEPLWKECGAVEMAPAGDDASFAAAVREVLGDDARRVRLGQSAAALYRERFDLSHTIRALREPECA